MKNILNKIYLHPLFIIVVFIFTLRGMFKYISLFMLLIIVHELGHIVMGLIFKWKIDRIIILPFGAITKFNTLINISIIEEFFVAIMGIIFQCSFFLLIKNKINSDYFSIINSFIIFFNLLPIYPLDGSKILKVFLEVLFCFKKSMYLLFSISLIALIILNMLFRYNILILICLIFMFIELLKYLKNINYIFNKFLIERYLYKIKFKNIIFIKNVNKMKKNKNHLLWVENKWITEQEYLKKTFDNNDNL